ncbi:MAG TPA: saccharopine dehydrogenase NADP-binding domain-containing protein [Polyangiaceae bacterium]|jgi:short subunit dehydrogenase-like uncharacterized protein|nr:saccharopine dehydrogenase NADP-binding domain-containing protein [Polyangiaceae bacterium]
MSETPVLLYGANGFTGRLIAERARERGLELVLAGRTREAVEPLAKRLGYEFRIFGLDGEAAFEGIRGAKVVLHCAGPYSKTSAPMVDACLKARAHYLDITGEYKVLEAVLARSDEAAARGVVLLPSVGFDVVPTDCMAQKLKGELPSAVRLELAFTGDSMMPSAGTAKTTVENLHVGAKVRRGGVIVSIPAPLKREIPFAEGARFAMSIPWGDIVTAFHSTGIPDITVYTVVPKGVARAASVLRFCAPVLKLPSVIRVLQKEVEKRAKGPDEEQRRTTRMSVWGRVEDDQGRAVEGHLSLPEGYELTVLAALASVERVLRGDVAPGATTPSRAFGADFVTTLPGVGSFNIVSPALS